MKRCLLLIVLLVVVSPVMGAAYDTFQDYSNNTMIANTPPNNIAITDETTGEVSLVPAAHIKMLSPSAFEYVAYEGGQELGLSLVNQSGSSVCNFISHPDYYSTANRAEIKIVSLNASLYIGGTYIKSCTLAQNPYNVDIAPYFGTNRYDNFVIGGTDHHAISVMPQNWTIVRDIMNPTSTGVYAMSSTGEFDALKNSQKFYIHADASSQESPGTEYVRITNMIGTVINTTAINTLTPHNIIEYDIDNFLAEAGYAYGQYAVHFDDSSVYDYFTVLGTGATIYFDRDEYSRQDTATATYTIEGDYWDTETFSYRVDYIDATTWETVDTNPISEYTGSVTYQFTDDDTPGTYYAVLIAKYRTSGVDAWMMLDWADLDAYATFYGYVMNQDGTVISGANVSATQGDIHDSAITIADGNYTVTGFYDGNLVRLNATASGYSQYNVSLTPLAAKRIALNITLNSTTPTVTGLGIGGVARDGVFNDTTRVITSGYGRPLSGATVYLWNFSNAQGYTKTTNIAGWYLCDDGSSCSLVPGRIYDVQGRKGGYNNSQNYTVVTS